MCDVTVGKLIRHNGDGFGFKITFSSEDEAEAGKDFVADCLSSIYGKDHVIIDSGGRYDRK